MFCPNCGKETPDSTKLCDGCGSDSAGGLSMEPQQILRTTQTNNQRTRIQTADNPDRIVIGRAFWNIFDSNGWGEILFVGALYFAIPVLGVLVHFGYWADRVIAVASGQEIPLPDFSFNKNLSKGLSVTGKFLLFIPFMLIVFLLSLGVTFSLEYFFGDMGEQIGLVVFVINSILFQIYFYIVMTIAVCENSNSIFIDFGRVFRIAKSNIRMIFMLYVSLIIAEFITGLGFVAFGIGMFFTIVFTQSFFMPHILGQFYAKAKNK